MDGMRIRGVGASAVLSAGIVGAGLVWWGLRSPTRLSWWGALTLSGAWLLNSFRLIRGAWHVILFGLTGRFAAYDVPPAVLLSYLMASVPTMAQAVILVAWLRGTSLLRASSEPGV
jgi:hypothetical protein